MKLQHTLSIQKDGKTISGKITGVEWGDSKRGDCKKIWNNKKDFRICSSESPSICWDFLFIWGDDKERDNRTISHTFESKARAKSVLNFINKHSVVNKLSMKKKKVVKKQVWKAGDFYPDHAKLTPFPGGKTAKELGLKVGYLVVGVNRFSPEKNGIVVKIERNYLEQSYLDNEYFWRFAPLPDQLADTGIEEAEIMEVEYRVISKKVFKKQPKLQKIQSAVWQYEDVKLEEGKIIFPEIEFTPEELEEFIKKGRRVLAQYKKIKF